VLNALVQCRPREALTGILLAGQLTFLAAAFASIVVPIPFGRYVVQHPSADPAWEPEPLAS
jgi:hypothetical protein